MERDAPTLSVALVAWAAALVGVVGNRLGVDAGDGQSVRRRPRRAPARASERRAHADARLRARAPVALARPRPPQAPRLAARGRPRRRLGGHAPREGPRLRGGDRLAGRPRVLLGRAGGVRRTRRSRVGACRSLQVGSRWPQSSRSLLLHIDGTRVLGAGRRRRRWCCSARLAVRGLFLWLRPFADARPTRPGDRRRAEALVQEHGTRQPRVLRAAARQVDVLLGERQLVPRLPRGRRNRDRRRRPDRRRLPSGGSCVAEFRRVAHAKALAGRDRRRQRRGAPATTPSSVSSRSTSGTRRSCDPTGSRSTGGRSARCASR